MSFYSAQLDNEGNVMAIVESSKKVEGKKIIPIDQYNTNLLNRKYEFDVIKKEHMFIKPRIRTLPGKLIELSEKKS